MPNVDSVKWGQDTPIEDAPKLSEEELHLLKERMKAVDKLFEQEQKGKYKIELMFGSKRRDSVPSAGGMSFWESGSKLHGGGDAKLYICPGKHLKKSDCQDIIPDASTGYGYLVCPGCKTVWKGEDVIGELICKLNTRDWAFVIHKYFVQLGHNADIYLKFSQDDIRIRARLEQEKQRMGEELFKARSKRVKVVYPLKNIIRETANGADLLTRFYTLLRA